MDPLRGWAKISRDKPWRFRPMLNRRNVIWILDKIDYFDYYFYLIVNSNKLFSLATKNYKYHSLAPHYFRPTLLYLIDWDFLCSLDLFISQYLLFQGQNFLHIIVWNCLVWTIRSNRLWLLFIGLEISKSSSNVPQENWFC